MVEKTFLQWLFRVPVAPVETNIHKKDDFSWLRPSEDTISSIGSDGSSGTPEVSHPIKGDDDPYTHPYDREVKSGKRKKDKRSDFATLHPEQENQ
ncbi:uncharacterized protein BKCO1_3100073 [Diplodia corticola]|uniref:Uncharacterized protein n=1 Tax=Diplodia corticola TaxID=236234 RepID=A0A1J9RYE9_9PEZI|nr:uncharacterized protein BKCO1_3100073 [Diplodia corticola]OJD33375.1 hypothetical protein BKCO1_3100073 [Diplodia corticola]